MDFEYQTHKKDIEMYVRSWIRRTSPHLFANFEDYLQEGVVAFLKCTEGYDGTYPFRPWLKRSIYNHLNNALKPEIRYNKVKMEVLENPTQYEESGVEHTVSYEQSDSVNIVRYRDSEEEKIYNDSIWSLMGSCDTITEEDKLTVDTYVECDGNHVKTGDLLGITREGSRLRINNIVDKLRDFSEMKEVNTEE